MRDAYEIEQCIRFCDDALIMLDNIEKGASDILQDGKEIHRQIEALMSKKEEKGKDNSLELEFCY